MTPRPVTDSKYINSLNPIDAINFPVWVHDYALPKIVNQVADIFNKNTDMSELMRELDEQTQILDSINRDLIAANQVAAWFMKEAPKHILMMSEEGDDIVITYDASTNWLGMGEEE